MSVLRKYYDKKVNGASPVVGDLERVVRYDEDGGEIVEWLPVDYAKIVKDNGTASMWSLKSLLSAGINPNFSIHTGSNSRIEGLDSVSAFAATADEILAETAAASNNNDVKGE